MFDNVLPTAGAGAQIFTSTRSHWYDLTSLWYDLVAFTALAIWAAFCSASRAWNASPAGQDVDQRRQEI